MEMISHDHCVLKLDIERRPCLFTCKLPFVQWPKPDKAVVEISQFIRPVHYAVEIAHVGRKRDAESALGACEVVPGRWKRH